MKFSKILTLSVAMLLTLVVFCSCGACEDGGFFDGICDLVNSWFPCDHEDTEWRVIKSATCDAEGTRASVCNVCGEIIESEPIAKVAHNWIKDKAVAPTCSKEGLTEGSHCSECNKVLVAQDSIEKKPHTSVIDEAVESTCSKTGLTEGSHCSVCKEVIVAQDVVEKKPHIEIMIKGFDSTCTQTGLTPGSYCSVCGDNVVEQTVIEKKPHSNIVIPAVAPTCTEAGLTEGAYCSVCNSMTVKQETVDALGHDIPDGLAPTCTTYGYIIHCCSRCGICIGDEKIESLAPLGHDLVKVSEKLSTCTESGSIDWKCSRCNYTCTTNVAPHETVKQPIVDKSVAPTCDQDGIAYWECELCHRSGFDVVPMLGHDMKSEHVDATCAEPGKTVTLCDRCGIVESSVEDADKTLNPDNHTIEIRITTPATCTNPGTRLEYCTRCSYMKVDIIPMHNWIVGETVPPTCDAEGYTPYTCTACGANEKRDIVAALNHDYTGEIETILPVCGKDGAIIQHCKNAGCDSYKELEAITYIATNPDHHGGHGKPATVCTNPAHKNYSGTDVEHPGNEKCDCVGDSIIRDQNGDVTGLEQYECESCGSRYHVENETLVEEKKD